jgi:hypothetical protein
VQAVADAHDTLLRKTSDQRRRVAICSSDHLLPFHRCTSVEVEQPPPPQPINDPTAMHAVAEPHETPLSPISLAGLGVWIDQRLPFQRSSSAPPSWSDPTAVQAIAEAQDTLLRLSPVAVGVFWIDHLLPSHLSTGDPTVVQAVLDVHDTAESPPLGTVGTATV